MHKDGRATEAWLGQAVGPRGYSFGWLFRAEGDPRGALPSSDEAAEWF